MIQISETSLISSEKYWNDAFERHFDPDRDVRSAVGIITESRNKTFHPGTADLTWEYAISRLHDIADILEQINAPEQKREVEAIRDELLTRAVSTQDVRSDKPNNNVIEDAFRKSEFAADLQEVYDGNAKTDEYGEAEIFFNQTYITPGHSATC